MSSASSISDFAVSTVDTARGPIEVARIGRGAPVLLVHGIPGNWRQTATLGRALAADYDVLLVSRPGYGATPVSSGESAPAQAALYAALLDALGLDEPVGVMGVSGGGPSASSFAALHPERVRALALVCALADHIFRVPTGLSVITEMPPLAKFGRRHEQKQARRLLQGDDATIDARIANDVSASELARIEADAQIRQDLIDFLHAHADAPPGHLGMRADARSIRRANKVGPRSLAAVAAPTLVVHGDADVVVPLSNSEYYSAAIPGATLRVVPDAGHIVLLTHRNPLFQSIGDLFA